MQSLKNLNLGNASKLKSFVSFDKVLSALANKESFKQTNPLQKGANPKELKALQWEKVFFAIGVYSGT